MPSPLCIGALRTNYLQSNINRKAIMIQAHQRSENFAHTATTIISDSRADKLQLLSMASDICQRRLIGSECPSVRQLELDKKWLFDEAMEALTSVELHITADVSRIVSRALRRAYDVFCADREGLDGVFFDVSYGAEESDRHPSASYPH